MEKNRITIRKKVYALEKKVILEGDNLIPDTKPDIISVVGTNGKSIFINETVQKGKLKIEGNWLGKVIYLSDLGEIKSLNVNYRIAEVIECNDAMEKDEITAKCELIKNDVKILNERKINNSIELNLKIEGYRIEEEEFLIESDDDDDIQKLSRKIDLKKYINSNSVKSNISEEFVLEENIQKYEILNDDIKIENIERKISYNKVLVKADAVIDVLYIAENGINVKNIKIPIMSFVEMEKASEENIFEINYRNREFEIIQSTNNSNTIEINAFFEVNCIMYEKCEVLIIEDMYSLKKKLDFKTKLISMEKIDNEKNDDIEINEKLGIDGIKNIYYYKYSLIKGIEEKIVLEIYYSKEDKNVLFVKSVEIPVSLKNVSGNYEIRSCEIKSVNEEWLCFAILEDKKSSAFSNYNMITEYSMEELGDNNNFSMVVYYIKPKETLWEIAKKFNVCKDSILICNEGLDEANLNVGDKLYIVRG